MEPLGSSRGIHLMLDQSHPLRRRYSCVPGSRWNRDRGFFNLRDGARVVSAGPKRLGVEWLEPRHLLTANLTPIAMVQPYDGEFVSQSPQQVVISFNGLSVPAFMGSFDVQIEELNRDGTRTPIWSFDDPPPEQSDDTGTELIVPLQTFNSADFAYDNLTLPAGRYEIDLLGGTGLSYAASGALGPGPQLWDPNQDHAIGTFTVGGQGATLNAANSLGMIGPTVQTTWGLLNPDDPQTAVDLYQFTLPEGHFWQVGLAIESYSIGSSLLPALSLMDADGSVLATRDSGTGLPSNPNDPYLFMGLKAGTYYIGVSGAGNLASAPGGYDPVLGVPGSAGLPQPGGPFPFALGLFARPHDQPTRLVNVAVDRSDPYDTSPTGLTLTFSGPIDVSKLFVPDSQVTAIQVVDSSGQVWPITAESYEVSDYKLRMIFDQPLPAGSYSLISSPILGLTDLAGQPVSGAVGTDDVLANWTVVPQTVPQAANDLGILWPDSTNETLPSSTGPFKETTVLAPGQGMDYRWAVIVPGFYKLQTQLTGGPVAVFNIWDGQSTVLDRGSTNRLNNYLMNLDDGVYTIRFVNESSQPVAIDWVLKIARLDWEKILNNGVSQTSALSLSLVSSPSADSGNNSAASVSSFQTSLASGPGSVPAGSLGPVPASLLVTLNTGLIGQPTLGSQNLAVVGPSVPTGSTALANNGNSLISEFQFGSTIDWSQWLMDEESLPDAELAGQKLIPTDAVVVRAKAVVSVRSDPLAHGAGADQLALGRAEWLVRLGARLQRWLAPVAAGNETLLESPEPLLRSGLVQNSRGLTLGNPGDEERNERTRSAAHADLSAATCVILVGATACRLRRPLLKWWRATSRLAVQGEKLARPLHRGPHIPSIRARATTRPGKLKALR
jgi:Bacterial pre-peptidase C-terminal domain